MGSTWNPDILEKCGQALAREMASYGVDMILGPNVNIHRDPLCGRLGESFSEDPYLVASLAPALIKGIQKEGVAACVKHFAANNQEKDRLGVKEHVPERALRENLFSGFKAAVDAGCKTVMSAYNMLNGAPSAMNKWLLTDVLRNEWGFKGFVVSDWGAAYEQIASVAAGTDLTMPGPRGIKCIIDAVENGQLPEEKLDECVRNVLGVVMDSLSAKGIHPARDLEASKAAAEAVLRESIVLLENDGTLPLSEDTHVAYYGKRAEKPTICPAGSSNVETDLVTNMVEETIKLIGEDHVLFETFDEKTKAFIAVVGADGREGADREHLRIDDDDAAALEKAIEDAQTVSGKVIVVLNTTGPVDLTSYRDRVNAILCPFFSGSQGGKVWTEAVFGKFNPSGHLAQTWPLHEYDCPAYKNFGGENKEVWYGEGIYVGYRWYDARHIKTLYPFGYGLSYTTFEITDVSVPACANVDKEEVPVRIRIRNTGKVAGSEVIQVYVADPSCSYDRPVKELKGFAKVYLEAGEEKEVTITLTKQDFSGYYTAFGEWIAVPGEFEILIGTSAENIAVSKTIDIHCRNPFGLSEHSAIGTIAADAEAVSAINEIIEDDIVAMTRVAIEFAPDRTIKKLWEGPDIRSRLKEKGWDDECIDQKYQEILRAFDRIEEKR